MLAILALPISLALAFSAEPRPASTPYKLDPAHAYVSNLAPVPVQTLDLTLTDKARKKDLELRIRAPKPPHTAPHTAPHTSPHTSPDITPHTQNGLRAEAQAQVSLPLIIFSHGAGGSLNAFPELSAHLASLGYVVVHPTHSDSLELRTRSGEDLSHLRENPSRLVADVDAPDRLADVSYLIDSIPEIEAAINHDRPASEHIRIDPARIGMAGHSAGAYTTQVALGAKVRGVRWGRGLRPRAHTEARIKAGVLISGQGTTNRSLSDDSWSEITTPMLVIAGSLDVSRISNETPESRREPFERARPGDKYLIYIEGATHGSYQGKALATMLRENPTTDLAVITAAVSSGTAAFFDRYLKDCPEAATYLESDAITALTSGAAAYERK